MKEVCVGFILNCSIVLVYSYTKVFKYDTDIYNKENWVNKKTQKECDGLIFPKILKQQWFLDTINVQKVVFPTEGLFVFARNGGLTFDKDNLELNCVQIQSDQLHYWEDPKSWVTKELLLNPAIPHKERIPCQYDDIVLPKGPKNYYVFSEESKIKVNSLKYENITFKSNINIMFQNILRDDTGSAIIITDNNSKCTDPSGCKCGNINLDVCLFITDPTILECIDPIIPHGFCHKICGASLILQYKDGFSLNNIQEKLAQYQSNTYASKIMVNGTREVIQVIFTETNFTGTSLEEAKNFHELVKSGTFLGVIGVDLFVSREVNRSGIYFWYIFIGTFLGVATFFFVLFSPHFPTISRAIRNARFNARPLSSYMFARYDANEDRGYIIENQSLAASVLSLDTVSFDNPTYTKNISSAPSENEDLQIPKGSKFDDIENVEAGVDG